MEIVVGTYDEVLLGYKLIQFKQEYQLEQTFTDNSHTGCVKCVNISSKGILASGSTDETIHLFNLKKRTELGSIVHHSGTVTCLDFYKGQHMFSASEDGTICIWKFFTWECLKTLRGHQQAVNWISVHPSGKLALSVGKDRKLRTWNLITGKCAYVTNIRQEADKVFWSPDGQHYVILFSRRIDVYATQTAEVTVSVNTDEAVQALVFVSDSVLVYGGVGGSLHFYDIIKQTQIHSMDTETNRIKAMCVVPPGEEDKGKEDTMLLLTASSDGFIKVYRLNLKEKTGSEMIVSHNTNFRLTCMAVSKYSKSNFSTAVKMELHSTIKVEKDSPDEMDPVSQASIVVDDSKESGVEVQDSDESDNVIDDDDDDDDSSEEVHHKGNRKNKQKPAAGKSEKSKQEVVPSEKDDSDESSVEVQDSDEIDDETDDDDEDSSEEVHHKGRRKNKQKTAAGKSKKSKQEVVPSKQGLKKKRKIKSHDGHSKAKIRKT